MILSIWRYSHLILAISSALFLIIASVTGVILAFEPISDTLQPYGVSNLRDVSIDQTISVLKNTYDEVLEVEITPSDFVIASVVTKDGDNHTAYLHPVTGAILGKPTERSRIFSFTTNLHRSLFLKGIGRFFVGFVSLLLCFITVTGFILLVQRQGGILKIFRKVQERNFNQRYHVILGRWLLLPILILAATGVYLSAEKFSLLPESTIEHDWNNIPEPTNEENKNVDFAVFKNTSLSEVRKITFPFSDDAEDYYEVALRDKEILVHQYTGAVISEVSYPFVTLASRWSLQLHTGQGSVLWSLILLVASGSLLFFMYSGFAMSLKRRKKTKGLVSLVSTDKDTCEYIILVGSETGNTHAFTTTACKALNKEGKTVFMSPLNEYTTYEKARYVFIFTATYGDGDAPSNARNFEKRVAEVTPINTLKFSVLGFGSSLYPQYCRFAILVDGLLHKHPSFIPIMPLVKVDDQEETMLKAWVSDCNIQTKMSLQIDASVVKEKEKKTHTFTVVEKTAVNTDVTFLLRLKSEKTVKFQSGDLLEITPEGEQKARQYSVAKVNENMVLSVRKHDQGKCSSYLSTLELGNIICGALEKNKKFHFPKHASSVICIANGTGIAPFLGMMEENTAKIPMHVFWGGRTRDSFALYEESMLSALSRKRIQSYMNAYSREGDKQYVQDILTDDTALIKEVLATGGTIMICGSLAMQHAVLDVLEHISKEQLKRPLHDFENNKQILTDCY
ncbi:MAG: sulfite reductase (NADPH) flavoprotein alpha-component [Dokdonia sp.]|jgi:sulfite reductase (NADPH) flavoprotein alpha-component